MNLMRIMDNLPEYFTCPICGFSKLDEEPFSRKGAGSFDICPSCGNQFGYTAYPNNITELRQSRIKGGCEISREQYDESKTNPSQVEQNALIISQLNNLGISSEFIKEISQMIE